MKHLLTAALGLLLCGCVLNRPPLSAGEIAVAADPPRHPTHPARNRQLVIPSGPVRPELGRPAEMNALMFQAAGPGPHPTLLLLHGLPGNERNLDLAQAARRAGWNVLTFTYRGAWGSEGTFSFQHAVADTEAALRWLRSEEAAQDYGVDSARIVVVGHSMGGFMAAYVATHDNRGRLTVIATCEAGCEEVRVGPSHKGWNSSLADARPTFRSTPNFGGQKWTYPLPIALKSHRTCSAAAPR
ncbi:MAG: alpha/beta hydrolase family protein [Allosphingosinicella sp.]|uniref:alpha/beta hydrolase family protein n=1 Tax=Allosphingosinicella sp. TaxID=2823234 RepID=UPI0039622D24